MGNFEKLAEAVNRGEHNAARIHLKAVLIERGGSFVEKFEAFKAERCENFEIKDGEVWFTIERHPGHWNSLQTWSVDASSGVALRDQRLSTVLSRDALKPFVVSTPARRRAAAARLAEAALEYGKESRTDERMIALAWVYLVGKSDGIAGTWPGNASMLRPFHEQLMTMLGDGGSKSAATINALAKSLWLSLVEEMQND